MARRSLKRCFCCSTPCALAAMVFLTSVVTNQKVLEYTVGRLSAAPLVCGSCAEKVKLAEDRAPRLRIAHRLHTLRHEHEHGGSSRRSSPYKAARRSEPQQMHPRSASPNKFRDPSCNLIAVLKQRRDSCAAPGNAWLRNLGHKQLARSYCLR